MSAEFFKHICKQSTVGMSVLTVAFSCLYADTIARAEYIDLSKNFYFLISDDLHLQASTHEMHLQGGAGYLLQDEPHTYVVYHVYSSLEQAQKVQNRLPQASSVILKSADRLYFDTPREKQTASYVCDTLAGLDGCMQVLDAEITRLEKGATQQSSKRILSTIHKQLCYIQSEYTMDLPSIDAFTLETCALLQSCIDEIVYAKDLRYALCLLSDGYLQLCGEYRL